MGSAEYRQTYSNTLDAIRRYRGRLIGRTRTTGAKNRKPQNVTTNNDTQNNGPRINWVRLSISSRRIVDSHNVALHPLNVKLHQ